MKALMQEFPLTLELVLERCRSVGTRTEVVSVGPAGPDRRTWSEVGERAVRIAGVLDALGVARGGRVATFAWNSHRHVELFLGVPAAGRVVHGVNVRLSDEEILYQVRHAADDVLFVDASLTGRLAPLRDGLAVRDVVVMEDGSPVHPAFARCPLYEDLLGSVCPPVRRFVPEPDDAAWICYTSGTTGHPKGVVASHQAAVLHSMSSMTVDSHAISRQDVLLAITPLFHVNAWGLPYTAAMAGTKLVLPGREVSGAALGALIESERVTVAAAVPTVWIDLLADGHDLSSLRRVLCGGAPAPRTLLDEVARRGLVFCKGWGMTEMLPSGTMQHLTPDTDLDSPGAAVTMVGRPTPGVQLRLVGAEGAELPWDGVAVGELQSRGPWVVRAYLDPEDDSNTSRFDRGWLRTGDLARIAPDGTVELVDRTKDVIKSGGEWISSLALEQALSAHPLVAEAAVVGVPDPYWGERPAAAIVATAGGTPPSTEELLAWLGTRVPKWWLPEQIVPVRCLPRTGVGKYDKKVLRTQLAGA
ncbi:fatty acid--CoA ligase [Kutzneria viridogrisea]|uniref:Fatty-acyl-CoA synthase n=1 Tax=Kutzneria viridogrisea TaxID=47990 RepID=A0ABR6BK41_9PSEU|nr:fatty-acyl-CoA synthase [Kutzneria viridogrisea]